MMRLVYEVISGEEAESHVIEKDMSAICRATTAFMRGMSNKYEHTYDFPRVNDIIPACG